MFVGLCVFAEDRELTVRDMAECSSVLCLSGCVWVEDRKLTVRGVAECSSVLCLSDCVWPEDREHCEGYG